MDDTIPTTGRRVNDCWNIEGVWGNGECPELVRHVHCRNCPVFSSSAARLLDGELPEDYVNDWTGHIRQKKQDLRQEAKSVVVFRVGAEWLALPTSVFREVAGMRPVHSLPHRRNRIVRGIANIRGELLLCISLGDLLGTEMREPAPDSKEGDASGRLMVVGHTTGRLVFPVEEIHGVMRYTPDEVRDRPATLGGNAAAFTTSVLSWEKRTIGLLDVEKLVQTINRSLS
ncbi:MAG TPA: chemotaxis protein CheW [Roseimicrobium sp.]|nr:chemotaxis protein CheW [Roseimicrobium sp.]